MMAKRSNETLVVLDIPNELRMVMHQLNRYGIRGHPTALQEEANVGASFAGVNVSDYTIRRNIGAKD